jgi:hypothetical protein
MMNNPNSVALLQQLTPANIQTLNRDQVILQLGLAIPFTPEELRQC